MLAALLTLAIPAPALAQQGGAATGADEQFKQGREAMNQKDYKRALELLRASHAREPGKGKLLNIALCEEQLGMTGSALRHFQELEPQFPSGDERAGIVKQHAAALDAKAPRLRVTLAPDAPPGTRVTLDGEALGAAGLGTDVPVDPGHHVVVAAGPQGGERRLEVEIAAGERKHLLTAPGAAPDASTGNKPGRPLGWTLGVVAVGVGGAALAAGIGVGIAALGKRSQLATSCDANRMCGPDAQPTIDAYHALGGASTGLVIGGAALAAGGAVLMVLAPGKKPAQSGWITPEIGPGMVGVRGSF
ncbi:MAG: hypothetical protein QM820_37800 [Minicystis sp.]